MVERDTVDLSVFKRLLLVVADGAEFPAAKAALLGAGFAGELRVVSHREWEIVIAGKCAEFIALPAPGMFRPLRALVQLKQMAPHRAWMEALVWVSPREGNRVRKIRQMAGGKPVFVFHQAQLQPWQPTQAPGSPETQVIQQREAELAVNYLRRLLERDGPPEGALRIGVDGDAMHERMATGIQWYRRHLYASLLEAELDLAVLYPTREPRTIWELPWGRKLHAIPATMRSYDARERKKAYPVEALTGPIDLFHMTFFDPLPLKFPRLVATIYDLMPLLIPETYPQRIIDKYKLMLPFWKNEVAHFVCISEATRKDLIEQVGIEPTRATTIHPGRHPHYAPRGEEEIADVRRRYGIEGPYLLALGSLVPHKNFQTLVRAFNIVRERTRMPHKLVIVGRAGWQASEVFDEIRKAGSAEAIIFAGYVDFCDTPALYSGAEAFCHTSIFEGYGLPVQEALCCGCPVLTSDCTSLPEVAGEAGIYWDPRSVDSIVETLTDFIRTPESRKAQRRRALARAEEFISWQDVAARHKRIYEQVLGDD